MIWVWSFIFTLLKVILFKYNTSVLSYDFWSIYLNWDFFIKSSYINIHLLLLLT